MRSNSGMMGNLRPRTKALSSLVSQIRRAFVINRHSFDGEGLLTFNCRVSLMLIDAFRSALDSWAGSSAWLEHSTDNREVKGSNPFRPISLILRSDYPLQLNLEHRIARRDRHGSASSVGYVACCLVCRKLPNLLRDRPFAGGDDPCVSG